MCVRSTGLWLRGYGHYSETVVHRVHPLTPVPSAREMCPMHTTTSQADRSARPCVCVCPHTRNGLREPKMYCPHLSCVSVSLSVCVCVCVRRFSHNKQTFSAVPMASNIGYPRLLPISLRSPTSPCSIAHIFHSFAHMHAADACIGYMAIF